jgi:outer membrane protein OmpU
MNTIKKIGLTALAGSLVATSAYAGSLDVTGGASLKYTSEDSDEVTGNPFTMGRGITFSGSGDVNGMAMNYFYIMDDAAFSSSGLSLDMGDNGTISFENGGAGTGIASMKDKIAIAGGEQAYDDMGATDHGLSSFPTKGTFGYKNVYEGYTVSAAWNKNGSTSTCGAVAAGENGSSKSIAISGDVADGLNMGIGYGDVAKTGESKAETQATIYGQYAYGGAKISLQTTTIDKPAGTSDVDSVGMGITYLVNENLSIGISRLDVDFNDASKSDEESIAVGASYTMGSMSVSASTADKDGVAGSKTADDKHTEVTLSFAF